MKTVANKVIRFVAGGVVLGFVALCLDLFFTNGHMFFYKGKESAKKFACLSNAKRLATAAAIYAEDANGRFMPAMGWRDKLAPFLKETSYDRFRCPEVMKQGFGYAFNSELSAVKEPKNPETIPLVFESNNFEKNASDPFTSFPYPGRHDGKGPVSFADGHAKFMEPSEKNTRIRL